MGAVLYVIPGSHPARAARLMLGLKGIEYKRRDLIPVASKGILRLVGFSRNTVPALKLDGEKIQGTKEIARHLDRIRPEPPLLPADPAARAAVEEAEEFADVALQGMARRILWNCLRRDKAPLRSYSAGARLGVPIGLAVATAAPIIAVAARLNNADDELVEADLAALPSTLDRIDGWIADGRIGGESPNVADLQLATSLSLMMTVEDLRPIISARPAGELAMKVDPDYPGQVPAGTLPPAWLEPLRTAAPA